jgi:cytochrome P450
MDNVTVDEVDRSLATAAFYADPYPTYRLLRSADPVHWSDSLGGWMLTRYEDVLTTLRDHSHFSSRGRMLGALPYLPSDARERLRPLEQHFSVGLINVDPPDHQRLRTLVTAAFTPRVVETLRPRIQALVDELLDTVQEAGTMDIIADLAYPLLAIVIAELMGVPPEDRDRFKVWSDEILAFQGTGRVSLDVFDRSQQALLMMREFLAELLAQRRAASRDDLLTHLSVAEAAGDRLTAAELLTTCVNLLTAGHESTTNLIGNGLFTLLTHPDEMRRLIADPSLWPTAVDEMLRYESPFQRNMRRVALDVAVGGKLLRRGDLVLQILGAANRDPAVFPAPDRFDIARQPNRHLAFGFGIHFCVGAPLARLEALIALGTMLRRFQRLELAVEVVEWQEHALVLAVCFIRAHFGG